MMSRIVSRHCTISTGRHNITKIQHCPISSQFDMWVDKDVPNWFPTLNNFYCSPFSKWPPQYLKNSILSDIIKIWYVGRYDVLNWFPTLKNSTGCHFQNWIQHFPISTPFHMWVDYDVPNWFLTLKNFYRSLKWPPQYRKNSTLSDIITIWYVGR